jgi:outer membrane lipoprotein SlyB
MKALTSKKAIIGILSLSSIVLAGTIKDYRSHSVASYENATATEEIIPVERSVASEEVSKVAQMYLPMNAENNAKINGVWEITRIVGSDEKVAFDKAAHPEDAKKSIKVEFKLVGTSLVQVGKKGEGLVYNVSLLSDFGTIALFKKMGNGYEILEAKKVVVAGESLVVADEVELILERALNQAKSNKVLVGNDVSGQVSLSAKSIDGLEVELRNSNGETQNVQIDHADLLDGGAFKADVDGEEVSGVVLNNGKDGYRISFVTGPIAGAMLNFVTKEQLEKVQEAEADQQVDNQQQDMVQEEQPAKEEVQAAAEKVMEERKEVAENIENQEPVQVLSADEIKATAEQNGFAF